MKDSPDGGSSPVEGVRAISSLVDPQLRDALQIIPDIADLSSATLDGWRSKLDSAGPLADHLDVEWEQCQVPGPTGAPAIDILLYRPKKCAAPLPVVISFHGGGYVMGTAEREHATIAQLAADLKCVILSVNYRRAPETPYPGPLEDGYAVLGWAHRCAGKIGIDPMRVGLRGVSAGGGIAAGLALLARERDEYPVHHVALVYPMLDNRTSGAPFTGQHVWTESSNKFAWSAYLGNETNDELSPYAVPARALDLRGFPPTFIAVGSIDLFVGECISFGTRLVEAGVPVELHVYAGAYHGFDLVSQAEVSMAFQRDLRRSVGGTLG